MLEQIPLPQSLRFEEVGPNRMRVIMEPFFVGYGITMGNSIRRVMLSSMPGAAITAVKVVGVDHEFSTIEHVKEDILEIILNLKKVRVRVHSEEPVKIRLHATGKKMVTAADFETTSDVEIINKDHYLGEITNKAGSLEMEVICEQGRGFVPVENREKEKLEAGMIAIDAIYSPLVAVSVVVENVRVGQRTDYDKLILDIETDGSITVQDVVHRAASILVDHFTFVTEGQKTVDTTKEQVEEAIPLQEIKQANEMLQTMAAPVQELPEVAQSLDVAGMSEGEAPKRKRGRPKKVVAETTDSNETPVV